MNMNNYFDIPVILQHYLIHRVDNIRVSVTVTFIVIRNICIKNSTWAVVGAEV